MSARKKEIGISSIIIIIALLLTFLSQNKGLTKAYVERVIDGDTIKANISNKSYNVRLIGVNTPETNHPTKGIEFYGPEAKNFTTKHLTGKIVWLEFDVQQKDKYGRLLAYVWVEKPKSINQVGEKEIREKMFNAILLLNGYAQVMTIQPNVKYTDYFVKFQKEAVKEKRGLWAQNQGGQESELKSNKNVELKKEIFQQDESSDFMVYVSPNSNKYHLKSCRYAASNYSPVPINIAKLRGLEPCKVCNPDTEYNNIILNTKSEK
ncbi:MAG: thermonuclease family protein [Fervidobacterium sp.]